MQNVIVQPTDLPRSVPEDEVSDTTAAEQRSTAGHKKHLYNPSGINDIWAEQYPDYDRFCTGKICAQNAGTGNS